METLLKELVEETEELQKLNQQIINFKNDAVEILDLESNSDKDSNNSNEEQVILSDEDYLLEIASLDEQIKQINIDYENLKLEETYEETTIADLEEEYNALMHTLGEKENQLREIERENMSKEEVKEDIKKQNVIDKLNQDKKDLLLQIQSADEE